MKSFFNHCASTGESRWHISISPRRPFWKSQYWYWGKQKTTTLVKKKHKKIERWQCTILCWRLDVSVPCARRTLFRLRDKNGAPTDGAGRSARQADDCRINKACDMNRILEYHETRKTRSSLNCPESVYPLKWKVSDVQAYPSFHSDLRIKILNVGNFAYNHVFNMLHLSQMYSIYHTN